MWEAVGAVSNWFGLTAFVIGCIVFLYGDRLRRIEGRTFRVAGLVSGSLAIVIVGLWWGVRVGGYNVCIGEKDEACSGHKHLSCYTNPEAWGQVMCRNEYYASRVRVIEISNRSGNKCGYGIYDISCVLP
ncbi:MAG: hypothetical protein E5X37_27145 [Mesorhizobium sp.]|uniref:hypothetical protein n=1 Tax=Mesorhizobium sp. TaxID=1871066 RepID=UPI0011F9B8B7|nr:hypothetical protein [Mesorhizobium sp.]TIR05325.1 MAG: hypothetical protein E5X37_27145 [Mesorhizobium sp.]